MVILLKKYSNQKPLRQDDNKLRFEINNLIKDYMLLF